MRLTQYASTTAAATDAPVIVNGVRWQGCIGVEGELTGDGRSFAKGALRWPEDEELAVDPLVYRYVQQDSGGHDNAFSVGIIDHIERHDDGEIHATGLIDMDAPYSYEAYQAIRSKRQCGVSMDLDDVTAEMRVAAELLEGDIDLESLPENGDGTVTVGTFSPDMEVQYTTDARIRAVTQVAIPAFARARVTVEEWEPEEADDNPAIIVSENASIVDVSQDPVANARAQRESLVASVAQRARSRSLAAPEYAPKEWFDNPMLPGPTAMTITKEGRIYGHIATWGSCHLSHSSGSRCVTPYSSASNYAWFHTGAYETEDGTIIDVGRLTMGTGHADAELDPWATLEHYDNTGTLAAYVRMYEDQHGIAFAGCVEPTLTPAQLRKLRASPLSADWRRVGYSMELVAGLAVNVPGYGIPRTRMHSDSLGLTSLVASGVLLPVATTAADDGIQIDSLSAKDVAFLRAQVTAMRAERAAALRASVRKSLVASAAPVNKKIVEAYAATRKKEKR